VLHRLLHSSSFEIPALLRSDESLVNLSHAQDGHGVSPGPNRICMNPVPKDQSPDAQKFVTVITSPPGGRRRAAAPSVVSETEFVKVKANCKSVSADNSCYHARMEAGVQDVCPVWDRRRIGHSAGTVDAGAVGAGTVEWGEPLC